jgi:hypothetical protein
MFRALITHPQEALHKRYLVYCVRIMSVSVLWHCSSETATVTKPTDIIGIQYIKYRCVAPLKDE